MSKENLKNKNHTSHFALHISKQKGITLIALIITIIVMLILTGVTLSITLGDNGLVNKAQEATEATEIAMDNELLLSAVVGAIGIDGKVNFTYLDSNLPEGFTGSNGTYTSDNGHAFTVSANGQVAYVGNGEIGEEIESEDSEIYGRYYVFRESTDFFELKEPNVFIYGCEGYDDNGEAITETMEMDVAEWTYDKANNTLTVVIDYSSYGAEDDVNTIENEALGTYIMNFEFIIENGEIINKIVYMTIIEDGDSGKIACYESNAGLEYPLNGTYTLDNGNARIRFEANRGTAYYEMPNYLDTTKWDERATFQYFLYNGTYTFIGSNEPFGDDTCWIKIDASEFSEDITIDGNVYIEDTAGL